MQVIALIFAVLGFALSLATFLSWRKWRRDRPTIERLEQEKADLCANWPRGANGYPLFQENILPGESTSR